MKTVLFVGAGRHQRRALRRARELGLRAAAIDRNPDAPGFADADVAETVDFADVGAAVEAARRIEPDGVLTVASDRAVPVAARIAEELCLPGIGVETARLVTHKVAMRLRLDEAGVPQPRFAAVRDLDDALAALDGIGLPAVLKPADSAGQRGIALVRSEAEVRRALPVALAESRSGDAILERFHEGAEVNCLAVARGGEVSVLTLSDRLRPGGDGFGVCLAHLYPAALDAEAAAEAERVAAASVRAIGLVDSVAYPQLLVSPDGVRLVEIAARVPAGLDGRGGAARDRRRPRRDRARCRRSASPSRTAAAAARAPAARDPLPDRRAGPAPGRHRALGERGRACARRPRASLAATRTSSRARRSARRGWTATGEGT